MFGDQLLVLAAVRPAYVLQLYTVELHRTRVRRTVDGELALAAVIDLTHSVYVLVAVWDIALVEQRQLDCRQVVI